VASQGGSLVVYDGRQQDHLRQQCQLRQQRFRSKFERRGGIDVAVDLVSEVQAMRKDVQSLSATADLAAHTAAMEQGGFEKTRTVVQKAVQLHRSWTPCSKRTLDFAGSAYKGGFALLAAATVGFTAYQVYRRIQDPR
jgi:threonine dehydrogenase-like Zn-dependent dehydrogenase